MKLTTIGTVIAERTLDLAPRSKVVVRIGKPRKFRGDGNYFCLYEILWPGKRRISYCGGVDAIQALELAMSMIATDLYTSPVAAKLTWLGRRDLGFPILKAIRDLVPKDKPLRQPSRKKALKARTDRPEDRRSRR